MIIIWWATDPNTTISGPPSARQRNAIECVSLRRADDDPTLNAGLIFQGIQTSNAKKPYMFVFFRGGGGRPDLLYAPPPPYRPAHDKESILV